MAVRRKRKTTARKGGGTKRKARPLSASVKKTLQGKAKRSKYTYGQLARVYRRGQGAYLSSGSRPGVSMSQWAFGRVTFIRGGHRRTTTSRGTRGKKKTTKSVPKDKKTRVPKSTYRNKGFKRPSLHQ